jgi:hypothetical protein
MGNLRLECHNKIRFVHRVYLLFGYVFLIFVEFDFDVID